MSSRSHQHYLDSCTEIYMRGGNADRLDYDKSDRDYYNDRSPEYTANSHFREIRDERERREQLQSEEDYYYELERQKEEENEYRYQEYLASLEPIPDEYYEQLTPPSNTNE